jgi:hypothetical protein
VGGILYNLGLLHGAFNNDPTNVGDGAQAFDRGDGNNYDLTDERATTAAAHGLQAFVQLKSLEQNPLSPDGLGA